MRTIYMQKSWKKRKMSVICSELIAASFTAIIIGVWLAASVQAKAGFFEGLFKGIAFTKDISRFFSASGRYLGIIQSSTKALYGTLKGICLWIAALGCILGFLDAPVRGDGISPGVVARAVMQYTAAATLISDADLIANGINRIGMSVMTAASNRSSSTYDIKVNSWYDMFRAQAGEGFGIWVIIVSFFLAMILYFTVLIAKIRIYKLCFICLIELCIRGMFLPLGISWISLDGIRGRWLSYLKGYAGVYIKIAIFYMIAYLAGIFMGTAAQGGITNITNCIYIISLCSMIPGLMSTLDPIIGRILAN